MDPLDSHTKLEDNATSVMRRFLINRGCDKVHIIFDNLGWLKSTPKNFEHSRRDKVATISDNESCVIFFSYTTQRVNGGKTYSTVEMQKVSGNFPRPVSTESHRPSHNRKSETLCSRFIWRWFFWHAGGITTQFKVKALTVLAKAGPLLIWRTQLQMELVSHLEAEALSIPDIAHFRCSRMTHKLVPQFLVKTLLIPVVPLFSELVL